MVQLPIGAGPFLACVPSQRQRDRLKIGTQPRRRRRGHGDLAQAESPRGRSVGDAPAVAAQALFLLGLTLAPGVTERGFFLGSAVLASSSVAGALTRGGGGLSDSRSELPGGLGLDRVCVCVLPSWSGAMLDAGVGAALVASSSACVLLAWRVVGGVGLVSSWTRSRGLRGRVVGLRAWAVRRAPVRHVLGRLTCGCVWLPAASRSDVCTVARMPQEGRQHDRPRSLVMHE